MISGKEKVCVQGLGKYGAFHAVKMLEYGTNIVCGVTKGKKKDIGFPVLYEVKEAVRMYGADTSILFVPPADVKDAAFEALESGIRKMVIITEHVPQYDTLKIYAEATKVNAVVIGPNCPGVILPGISKIGIMPPSAFRAGDMAIISKSGTLMYEISKYVSVYSSGVKLAVGLGGDPITCTSVSQAVEWAMRENVKKIRIVGELGGNEEVEGVKYAVNAGYDGEIKVFFVGRHAPKGKRMGHAGAIVRGYSESVEYKQKEIEKFGVKVVKTIADLV